MRRIPFTRFLVVAFGSVTVLAVVIEATVSLSIARNNTAELLRDKATTVLDGIESRVDGVLQPVMRVGNAMARLGAGERELSDPRVAAFAIGTMNALPQVRTLTIRRAGGGGLRFTRRSGEIESDALKVDVDALTLIEEAEVRGVGWWRPARWRDGEVILTYVSPAFLDNGGLIGLLVLEVSGGSVSRATTARTNTGDTEQRTPFILSGLSDVIAHPLLAAGGLALPAIDESLPRKESIGDAVLERIWDRNELPVLKLDPNSDDVIKGVGHGKRAYLFVMRTSARYSEEPWVIGAYLDGQRTRTQVRRLAAAAIAGGIIVITAIVAAVFIGRRACAPAVRLANAATLVREDRLDEVPLLPRTRLAEFDDASDSFNQMVEGLREGNVIRDLFGKFVPTSVAADMLHSPGGLEPQMADATILFVDMQGFTALTARLEPRVLVKVLNDYFSDLVEVIESEQGVVTQFQGDAILAVFNVPRAVADHPQRAVQAARRILDRVHTARYHGEALACRIGIATGGVVAGNVGATGRMNYTVHGDAVNLAARLEQQNKQHGTRVLIAGSTVKSLTPDIALREVGSESVRGQSVQVRVYTLADAPGAGPSGPGESDADGSNAEGPDTDGPTADGLR